MDDTDRAMYEREIAEREDLIEACPIDVYVPSINPRWSYPRKLLAYFENRPGVADSAREVVVDSGKRRVGNMAKIIQAARDLGADQLIPPDLTPFVDGYEDLTAGAHASEQATYYWQWQRADLDARLLLPIHPPYDAFLHALRRWDPGHVQGLADDPHFDCPAPDDDEEVRWNARGDRPTMTYDLVAAADGVAVGGLRGLALDERIDALRTVRRAVGPSGYVHALAPGTEPRMVLFLRRYPTVVDSLDISTPETAPANGKMADASWTQRLHLYPPGTNSSTVRGAASSYMALQLNYMLGPWFDEDAWLDKLDEDVGDGGAQTTLGDHT